MTLCSHPSPIVSKNLPAIQRGCLIRGFRRLIRRERSICMGFPGLFPKLALMWHSAVTGLCAKLLVLSDFSFLFFYH